MRDARRKSCRTTNRACKTRPYAEQREYPAALFVGVWRTKGLTNPASRSRQTHANFDLQRQLRAGAYGNRQIFRRHGRVARGARIRSARCYRAAVLPELGSRPEISPAVLPARTVARRRRVAHTALGAEVSGRTDAASAFVFLRRQLVPRHAVANRMASGCGPDGGTGIHVRAGRTADRMAVSRETLAALAGF